MGDCFPVVLVSSQGAYFTDGQYCSSAFWSTDGLFETDGEFNKGSGAPTWAAVLAFVNVDFPGGPEPVLYTHPRFRGDLPESLSSIERKTYDPRTGAIVLQPSQRAGFFKQIGFVSV
jgi:hypothetical protein